jgi:hypothetical protein
MAPSRCLHMAKIMGILGTLLDLKSNVKIMLMQKVVYLIANKPLNIYASRCTEIYMINFKAYLDSFFAMVCLDEILR